MNTPKNGSNYRIGHKNTAMKIILACGCLPFRSTSLLSLNDDAFRYAIRESNRNGDLNKIHDKKLWVYGLSETMRSKFPKTEEEIDTIPKDSPFSPFAKELLHHYLQYGSMDYKKCCFASDREKKSRAMRIQRNAEAFMFFYGNGIRTLPGDKTGIMEDAPAKEKKNSYYTTRDLRITGGATGSEEDGEGENKNFSSARLNGCVILEDETYAVINCSYGNHNYSYGSEIRARRYINSTILSQHLPEMKGSILLYSDSDFLRNMVEPKTSKDEIRVENLLSAYERTGCYALPLTRIGQDILKIMKKPEWKEIILSNSLKPEWRNTRYALLNCDGVEGKNYFFVFCIPDIARLKQFVKGSYSITDKDALFHILCFEEQVPELEWLASLPRFRLKKVPLRQVLKLVTGKAR